MGSDGEPIMEYRWLDNQEILDLVNPVCRERGWAEMNVNAEQPTCRVKGAFDGNKLVGFLCLQLYPLVSPLYVEPDARDGEVSRELTEQMYQFLHEAKARGVMTVCESPVSERLAARYGMTKLEEPVYIRGEV
jgi:Acetyltransferase (GNAT) domain